MSRCHSSSLSVALEIKFGRSMSFINDCRMDFERGIARRQFLSCGGFGIGAIAANSLLAEEDTDPTSDQPDGLNLPHFAPRAKRVIFLTQSGGPSQLELFDHKPGLKELAGTKLPDSVRQGQRLTGMTKNQEQLILPPVAEFRRHGECGAMIGEWMPHLGKVADEICFVKSMVTDQINHAPAMTKFLTGHHLPGRPSMGCWASYGLGSVNRDLPDYVVLISKMKRPSDQPLYDHYWGSGFLPSEHQGVKLRNSRDPVLYLNDPDGYPRSLRRKMLDGLSELNREHHRRVADPEIQTRIQQYEMAFRMQTSVPELIDTTKEPKHIFDLYGAKPGDGSFASNCLLARRLAERGTRFIQLYHRGWDHHGGVKNGVLTTAKHVDKASAALIKDLKDRGMLEDTLVIWGGEFGRTPMAQGSGRDHHIKGFSFWMAGGGVKGGISYGNTDEFGYNAVEDVVTVHDFHATLLAFLGIDHEELTYHFAGRDFRLTDVHGRVINEIFA